MPEILLVDDDTDAWSAVRLALEPDVHILALGTLHEALKFLKDIPVGMAGVIVDLNLTGGSDNFGRQLLERLRDLNIPCVIFSHTIKSPEDAARYQSEFGVLGTIGKNNIKTTGEVSPLEQLRRSVVKMIATSLEKLRERKKEESVSRFALREKELETLRQRSNALIADTQRAAGAAAGKRISEHEYDRIQRMSQEFLDRRKEIESRIKDAQTIEELEAINISALSFQNL